ncbi:MAG: ABC transporter substrate-binding protein [Clostridiaceae bacterium]|nr:ABC transporter substrate-binding protein [Clostridiaceae bacterium]
MKKTTVFILILALMLGLLAGCSNETPGSDAGDGQTPGDQTSADDQNTPSTPEGETMMDGGTIAVQMLGDLMSFCPDLTADDNFYGPAQNLYNRLVKLDQSSSVIPDLASSWDFSTDGKTLTFHLKDNAKWHDGEPVTAADVKYTFDYIAAHDTCALNAAMAEVDSIDAPDITTVVFNMNTVDMAFPSSLAWYGCFIMPQHIYDNGQEWGDNEAATTNPIGSGPFKFSEYNKGENLTLVANEDYHDGAPILDKVIYSIVPDEATALQALLNGELDWVASVPNTQVKSLKSNDAIRLDQNTYPSPLRIVFNLQNETVADLAVRQAIALCVDRTEASEKAHGGVMPVEYSAYPHTVAWACNTEDTYPECDVVQAVSVLEAAGYTKDADGYYVRGLTCDVFDVAGYPDTAKLVAAKCKEAGIEMTVQVYEYSAWEAKIVEGGDWICELQGGYLGPDPAAMQNRVGTGGWGNVGAYSNARIDELLAQGASTSDQEARRTAYFEMQKILVTELPYINIVDYAVYEGATATLRNLPIDGAGKWGWGEYTYTYFVKY